MDKQTNKVTTITSTLEEKKKLQGVLDSVNDKPLFEDKVNQLNEVVNKLKFSADPV